MRDRQYDSRTAVLAVLTLTIATSLWGCASASQFGRVPVDQRVIYPAPPDTARIQFLFTLSNERDVQGKDGSGWLERIAGDDGSGSDAGTLIKPYGIDLDGSRFYVCDTMLPGVVVIDADRRTLEPVRPGGEGALRQPVNCTVEGESGLLFVTDTDRGQVVVFDSTMTYQYAFGDPGGRPVDVFVDDAAIWVADLQAQAVQVYDRESHRLLRSIPSPDVEPEGSLYSPTSIWVSGDRVYVSDFGDFKVKVYDRQGRFVRSVGEFGRGLGQFVRPKGIAVDREGRLYVVDAGFDNVQVFDSEGRLLMFFGGAYSGPGDLWLPAQVVISYEGLDRFRDYVDPAFDPQYLILVTSQYGPDLVNVYAFVAPRDAEERDHP